VAPGSARPSTPEPSTARRTVGLDVLGVRKSAALPAWLSRGSVPIVAVAMFVVLGALGFWLIGGGLGKPTPGPSGIGSSTSAPATVAPATPAPTAPQTPGGSVAQTPAPTAAPVLAPGIGLGATTVELDESFTTPGAFPVSSDDRGSLGYSAGAFAISVVNTDYSLWSPYSLPARHAVMRVHGSVVISTPGSFGGLMCGNGAGDYLYGGVGTDNNWAIGQIVSSAFQTLQVGTIPIELQVPRSAAHDVRIECAVTGGATDRLQLILNGTKIADSSAAARVGPFSRGALLDSSGQVTPAVVRFDDVTISTGEAFRESTEALRDHVPDPFRSRCRPVAEDPRSAQVSALVCAPAGTADQAEYYQFESRAPMDTQFTTLLSGQSVQATSRDCRLGPASGRYNDSTGADAGSIACFPNSGSLGGLMLIWTNERLNVLSYGVSTAGSYADLFNWWQTAGPNP
jgi:hypothetical protein